MNSIENLKEISRVIRKDIVEMLTESGITQRSFCLC